MPHARTILVGTPAMDGRVHVEYVQALLQSQIAARHAGISVTIHFVVQDSLIMQARNGILAVFRESEATDLVFIDSDIAWDPEGFLKLVAHDVPIVAGVYRRKSENISFTVQFPDSKSVQRDVRSGLIEASRVGAGFLRLRRDAIEQMVAAYPQLRHVPSASGEELDRYGLFDTSLKDGAFCGEDYTFCDRWRAIGGTIWIDPDIRLSHIGTTAYTGSIWDFLKS